MRSKKSTGNKTEDTRHYSVRLFLRDDKEWHLVFNTCSYDEFELSAGDEVAFIFQIGETADVYSIYNLTTSEQFMNWEEEDDGQDTPNRLALVIRVIVVVYLIGVSVALAPVVKTKWTSVSAYDLVTGVGHALPDALAWPIRLYHNMTNQPKASAPVTLF